MEREGWAWGMGAIPTSVANCCYLLYRRFVGQRGAWGGGGRGVKLRQCALRNMLSATLFTYVNKYHH